MNSKNNAVTLFLVALNHPLYIEIQCLREVILSSKMQLSENIKWNAPNYFFENQDCITMRIQPTSSKFVQLVFHFGAKKQQKSTTQVVPMISNFLIWKTNERAIMTFKSVAEIDNASSFISEFIEKWIAALKLE